MNLLEKVKINSKKRSVRTRKYTRDQAQVAVAWLKGDVRLVDIAETLGHFKNNAVAYVFIALALSRAYELGMLKIDYLKFKEE